MIPRAASPPNSGLCGFCRFSRVTQNRRGSSFLLCRKWETDPGFEKYPPLPVLDCKGFTLRSPDAVKQEERMSGNALDEPDHQVE